MRDPVTFRKALFVALVSLVFLSVRAESLLAQSSDQNLPTAILSNEISGTIRALDLGDPRLTRYFYAFDGTPGDLIITLDSKNLNGDVDVFTAVTFRPLMKISMYAEVATPQVTKSIYVRSRQIFILRVEARTPNDENGSYHISFSGSFQPFSGGIPVAETTEPTNENQNARQSNVSSVGARIERPSEPVNEAKPAEQPSEETAKASSPTPSPRSTRNPRRGRGRTSRSARNRPAPRKTESPKTETAKSETTEPSKPAEGEEKSATPPAEKPATPPESTATEKPPPQPSGPHLIIERSDGNRLDRPMSAVRRVVIESGVIIVTLKNGRVERIPLALIVKMSIEP